MRDLSVVSEILHKEKEPSVERMLLELAMFGQPRLGIYGSGYGWHCSVNMFVTGQGIQFEVKSSFDHLTPISAVKECMQRLYEAMSKL